MKEELNQSFWHQKGVVWLEGEINDSSASRTVKELLYLLEQGFSTISLCINSPGGSVTAGFWIHDTIKLLEKEGVKVRGVCCGICASMAAFILASCTIREAMPNSETMIHQPLGGMQGQAADMRIAWEHMQSIKHRYEKLLAKYTGQTIETIQTETDRDNYMNAEEALRFGIIDRTVESVKDIWGE